MADLTDETLMAYADGLLDDASAERVRLALAVDEHLRQRLEPFLVTGPNMANLFVETLTSPIPSRLIAAVLWEKSPLVTGRQPSLIGRIAGELSSLFDPRGLLLASACAASLAVGIGTGVWLTDLPNGPLSAMSGRLTATGALQQALETGRSGSITQANGFEAKAVASFRGKDNWCREYELTAPDRAHFAGVACRGRDGSWVVAAHTATSGGPPSNASNVRPSAHADVPVVDAVVEHLMAADAVATVEEEQSALSKAWRVD